MQRPAVNTVPRQRGRPRNPSLEVKILTAAASVYGLLGWAGFNLDAVARSAAVGKSTIYARWDSAEALLGAMIEQRWRAIEAIDTGVLREDLQQFGIFVLGRYRETGGNIVRHWRRDLITYPDLAANVGAKVEHLVRQSIVILERGRRRGQLRDGVNLALASDILLSAMESQAGCMPPDQEIDEQAATNYVQCVVELLLDGIATSVTTSTRVAPS